MKLTGRYVLLIVTLVAAVASSRYAGQAALSELDAALNDVVRNDVARLLAITHSRRLFRSMVVHQRDYVQARSDREREALGRSIAELSTRLAAELDRYAQLMPIEDRPTLNDIRRVRTSWLELDARVRELARVDPDQALALAREPLQPGSWEQLIGELVLRSEKRLNARTDDMHRVYLAAERQLMWVSLAATLLAGGFGSFIFVGIRRNVTELMRLKDGFEAEVKERTQLLAARERALTLVLDSTGDGLIEIGRDARLTGVCSVAAVRWFGPAKAGTLLSDYLLAADPGHAAQFSKAIAQLADENVPWEVSREQMPRRFVRGSLTLELDFKRVMEDGRLTKILLVLRDVSDTPRAEEMVKPGLEQAAMLGKLLDDKHAFSQTVSECEQLLSSLTTGHDLVAARRELGALARAAHKLGCRTFAEQCESALTRLGVPGGVPLGCDVADLVSHWHTRMRCLERFLIDRGVSPQAANDKHLALFERLLGRVDCEEILGLVESWSRPRTAERLARLRAHAEHLAQRLGKSVHVTIEHNDLRLPQGGLAKFWPSLIHVVRNAVEHAVQTPELRRSQGKPAEAQLTFATIQTPEGLVVELRDDGPGLDRESLLRSARGRGGPISSAVPLRALAFTEGVSSRPAAADARGRGLPAVRDASDAEGGIAEVNSDPGHGTTFRFRFRLLPGKGDSLASRFFRRSSLRPVAPPPLRVSERPSAPARKSAS